VYNYQSPIYIFQIQTCKFLNIRVLVKVVRYVVKMNALEESPSKSLR